MPEFMSYESALFLEIETKCHLSSSYSRAIAIVCHTIIYFVCFNPGVFMGSNKELHKE